MLSEYFTEIFISNLESTAIKNDHMKQVETPGGNSLHLLTVDDKIKCSSSNEKQGLQSRKDLLVEGIGEKMAKEVLLAIARYSTDI